MPVPLKTLKNGPFLHYVTNYRKNVRYFRYDMIYRKNYIQEAGTSCRYQLISIISISAICRNAFDLQPISINYPASIFCAHFINGRPITPRDQATGTDRRLSEVNTEALIDLLVWHGSTPVFQSELISVHYNTYCQCRVSKCI